MAVKVVNAKKDNGTKRNQKLIVSFMSSSLKSAMGDSIFFTWAVGKKIA